LLIDILPFKDIGVAIIIFTILVKICLFPLSKKAVVTQLKMKELEPQIIKIKEREKDPQKQTLAIMDFYRKNQINPFSSFFLVLIQIPIILALYFVFYKGGLPKINQDILYSFIPTPKIDMHFLGFFDMAGKSLLLAIFVGITQFLQVHFAIPSLPLKNKKENTFKDSFIKSFQFQMKYIMPVFIALVAYNISGAICLYWITSNVFAIFQELYIKKNLYNNSVYNRSSYAK
jgi:YidC/Oxa1 family membrane protein insertase